MLNLFSSKPQTRTTHSADLREKAIAYLDKHYKRLEKNGVLPNKFYMLDYDSINGIAQYTTTPAEKKRIENNGVASYTATVTISYTDTINRKRPYYWNNKPFLTVPGDDMSNVIWYRDISVFGNSAMNAVLGGKLKTKRKKRSKRSVLNNY